MGLADKLLCEVIQFNLRAATIIIAAMNMVWRRLSTYIIIIIVIIIAIIIAAMNMVRR